MSGFEWIYKDGVPTEKMFNIEKRFEIEKPIDQSLKEASEDHADAVIKEMEKPIEKVKIEGPKRKPNRVHSKSNKAAVASVQTKLPKRSR